MERSHTPRPTSYHIEKIPQEGGQPLRVRTDNAQSPASAPDGTSLYHTVPLANVNGAFDFEVRVARPENGPSQILTSISSSQVPPHPWTVNPVLSPNGKWLAAPLAEGGSTSLWSLSTSGGAMRRLTDFGQRRVIIARRICWSSDSRFIFAAVGEGDADVVLLDRFSL